MAWLDQKRNDHLSQTVIFSREGYPDTELAATMGVTHYDVLDEYGVKSVSIATDFIVSSASLVLSGFAVLPKVGDLFKVEENETYASYEVLDLDGRGHFQRADAGGVVFRIHTKQVELV